jgi:AraC-like DNA-binding protein
MGSVDHSAKEHAKTGEHRAEGAANRQTLGDKHIPPFRAVLSTIVRSALADGYPSVERVAQRLQVPVRTLQRRLNEQGLTYSDLVERLRYREACRMLKRTEKRVAAIAAALGYTDPSHFSRAFRRWSGMRPSQYRVSQRIQPGDDAPAVPPDPS